MEREGGPCEADWQIQCDDDKGKGQTKLGVYMWRTGQQGSDTLLLEHGRASETGAEAGRHLADKFA